MRNRNFKRYILMVLIIAAVAAPSAVSAQAARTDYAAEEVLIGMIPGKMWTADAHFLIRDATILSLVDSDQPGLVSGDATALMDANLDLATGCGHIGGSFRLDVAEDCYWEGTFTGEMCVSDFTTFQLSSFVTRAVAHGGGELKGLQLRFTNENGQISGVILNPQGQ